MYAVVCRNHHPGVHNGQSMVHHVVHATKHMCYGANMPHGSTISAATATLPQVTLVNGARACSTVHSVDAPTHHTDRLQHLCITVFIARNMAAAASTFGLWYSAWYSRE